MTPIKAGTGRRLGIRTPRLLPLPTAAELEADQIEFARAIDTYLWKMLPVVEVLLWPATVPACLAGPAAKP